MVELSLLISKVYEGKKMKEEGLFSAIVPLLKLITLTLIGVLLAHPRAKLVPRATLKLLSKLVFGLFLPCMIFTNLGQSITLTNFTLWWFIPLNVVISITLGSVLGYVVALICRPPPQYFRFTIIMTALGNMGNLPLAIITSICDTKNHPFGQDCEKNGVAYASFAQWVAVCVVYTFVYHMMEPPLEYYEVVVEDGEIEEEEDDDDDDEIVGGDENDELVSMALFQDAEWPGFEDKEIDYSKTPFVARVFNSLLFDSLRSMPAMPELEEFKYNGMMQKKPMRCLPEPKMMRKFRIVAEQTPVKHILSPPIIASILAVLVGVIPGVKGLVFGDEAALSFLTESFEFMGNAMMPCAMLVLGGMLAEGPEESRLGIRTTVGIIVARLVVLPVAGIGVVMVADKVGVLVEGDEMYKLVILLHYVTPSAILLGAIASLRGYAVQEASAILFWQHLVAVVSVSVYMFVYFRFLFTSFA